MRHLLPGCWSLFVVTVLVTTIRADTHEPRLAEERILLGGKGNPLTIDELVRVAQMRVPVDIDPHAFDIVERSYALLMRAGADDYAIYGLTRGVGENKDKPIQIFDNGELTKEGREALETDA